MNEKKKIILLWIFILLVIGIFISYYGVNLFSILEISSLFPAQYTSGTEKCGQYKWMGESKYGIILSNEAIISDYKVITEVFSSGEVTRFNGCMPNTCNAQLLGSDTYGCDVWTRSENRLIPGCKAGKRHQCNEYSHNTYTVNYCGKTWDCEDYSGCEQFEVRGNCVIKCGGADLTVLRSGDGCYSKNKVFYKDRLIYESPLLYSVERVSFREGNKVDDMALLDFHIDFNNENQYYSSSGRVSCPGWSNGKYIDKGCKGVNNKFIFKIPSDAINFSINIPKDKVLEGDVVKGSIELFNNWMDIEGRLEIEVNIPYKVFGSFKETSNTTIQIVNITKGKNVYYFTLPTEFVTRTIFVTPTLHLLMRGNKFKGVNYFCLDQPDRRSRDISSCEFVSFGVIKGDKAELSVFEKTSCPENFVYESGFCSQIVKEEVIPQWVYILIGIMAFIIIGYYLKNRKL